MKTNVIGWIAAVVFMAGMVLLGTVVRNATGSALTGVLVGVTGLLYLGVGYALTVLCDVLVIVHGVEGMVLTSDERDLMVVAWPVMMLLKLLRLACGRFWKRGGGSR